MLQFDLAELFDLIQGQVKFLHEEFGSDLKPIELQYLIDSVHNKLFEPPSVLSPLLLL